MAFKTYATFLCLQFTNKELSETTVAHIFLQFE